LHAPQPQESQLVSKVGDVIKHELQEAVFPTIFFFVVFHILVLTKSLVLDSYNIGFNDFTIATVGAVIVAKVILIFDGMSFTNIFRGRPLIYGVLWKSLVYSFLVLVFRLLEEVLSGWSGAGSLAASARHFLSEVTWLHYLIVQIWVLIALMLYNSIVALDGHFGDGSMKRIFLGLKSAD
jgi:hypothetical protein